MPKSGSKNGRAKFDGQCSNNAQSVLTPHSRVHSLVRHNMEQLRTHTKAVQQAEKPVKRRLRSLMKRNLDKMICFKDE